MVIRDYCSQPCNNFVFIQGEQGRIADTSPPAGLDTLLKFILSMFPLVELSAE